MNILPETLKHYRNQAGLTQDSLAEATSKRRSPVSLSSIKRIESFSGGPYTKARPRVVKALADVLGVEANELSTPPRARVNLAGLRRLGYRQVGTLVDGRTALSFEMVEQVFGVSIATQIEMAPLCMALLAEGSLKWRQDKISAVDRAAGELMKLGGGHLSFAFAASRIEDCAADEAKSIRKRDLFGKEVSEDAYDLGYDPDKNNPFADYLRELAANVSSGDVEIESPAAGTWKTAEGMPDYTIGERRLDQITGGDHWAWFALTHGYVRIRDVPKELLADSATTERVAWLANKIPADIRAEQQVLFDGLNDLDLGSLKLKGD